MNRPLALRVIYWAEEHRPAWRRLCRWCNDHAEDLGLVAMVAGCYATLMLAHLLREM